MQLRLPVCSIVFKYTEAGVEAQNTFIENL